MKWKDEYATGVQRIDKQHMTIFKMADDFRSALDDGTGENIYPTLLEFLVAYCKGHFHFEERCMAEHRCPVQCSSQPCATIVNATGLVAT